MPSWDEFTIKSINSANIIPRDILLRADLVISFSHLGRLFKTRKYIPMKSGRIPITITKPVNVNGSVI